MTRRALLAGGALLVAGCGRDEAAAPLPRPVDALMRQLAAERAVVAAVGGLAARAPDADRALVRRIAGRARDRARMLAAAVSAEGGRPHEAPAPEAAAADPAAAVDRERAALAAHVAALPDLTRAQRRLATDLIPQAAADAALLAAVFDLPAAQEPFPGTTA